VNDVVAVPEPEDDSLVFTYLKFGISGTGCSI